MKTSHGYYSKQAADLYGDVIYETAIHQNLIAVTLATKEYYTSEEVKTFYKWKDTVYVGEIGKCIRPKVDSFL
jgi:hypothetical protein